MPDNYHNKTYLKKKTSLKFYEIELINLIKKKFKPDVKKNFLDVGCANGNLIFNLRKFYQGLNFTGIDVHSTSILLAKKKFKFSKNAFFYQTNILKFNPKKKFDIIVAAGLISFFEKFEIPCKQLFRLLKKEAKSKIFIFGRFNSSNIDTQIKFRNNDHDNQWRSGFNSYSIKTVSNFFKKNDFKVYSKKFNLPINLKKRKDLTRTYTEITKNNKKIILNRANIIAEFYYLVAERK